MIYPRQLGKSKGSPHEVIGEINDQELLFKLAELVKYCVFNNWERKLQ